MDSDNVRLMIQLALLESVQLFLIWAYVRHRYRVPLRQLDKLTRELARGERPNTYYIAGSYLVEQVTRQLEEVGARQEQTQRREREEAFNLNVLLANMVEGVMVVDDRHVIRLVNRELMELFALKQSPVDRTVLEALRESRIELVIREAMHDGSARRQDVTLGSVAPGGPDRHFDLSVVPIRNKKSAVNGAVVVFHDITRIKQLEVVRRDFVANVSHELRTPLAIFRGYLETLLEHPDLPADEVHRVLGAMQRNSNRLNALVEDLLALTKLESRQEKTVYTTIHLDVFLRRLLCDWEKREAAEPSECRCFVASSLPPVEVDTLRFEQVMLNLLENAVAYSSAPRRIEISGEVKDEMMEVRVTDNGIGIPPGDLPHVFERFYRVDKARARASGGTGLGLSICRQIIESHGGTIHAESEMGKGTTVVLRVPLEQGAVEA